MKIGSLNGPRMEANEIGMQNEINHRLCPPQLQRGKRKFDHHLRIGSLSEQALHVHTSDQIDDKVV